MSSIDEQFVEYIVKSVVGNPDKVVVKRTVDEKGVLLELTVDPDDLGRVIGKRGATAQSLRTLLRALGTKNDARYNLKIVDNGAPKPARATDDHRATEDEATTAAPKPAKKDKPAKDEPAEESVADIVDDVADEMQAEESDMAAKTRQELADMDDLDI